MVPPELESFKFLGLSIKDRNAPYKLFGSIIGLWALCWILAILGYGKPSGAGEFGDMFGAINALFSGLAFAGLIFTILLQMEELRAQRVELHQNTQALKDQKEVMGLQKNEMERQAESMKKQWEEMEKQNTNLKRERFENTFLKMIEIHLSTLNELYFVGLKAVRAIESISSHVVGAMQKWTPDQIEDRTNVYTEVLKDQGFTHVVSPYVRSLTATFEQLREYNPSTEAFNRYVFVLKSYLSSIEIEFLYYHAHYCKRDTLNARDLDLLNDFLVRSNLNSEAAEYINAKRQLRV